MIFNQFILIKFFVITMGNIITVFVETLVTCSRRNKSLRFKLKSLFLDTYTKKSYAWMTLLMMNSRENSASPQTQLLNKYVPTGFLSHFPWKWDKWLCSWIELLHYSAAVIQDSASIFELILKIFENPWKQKGAF